MGDVVAMSERAVVAACTGDCRLATLLTVAEPFFGRARCHTCLRQWRFADNEWTLISDVPCETVPGEKPKRRRKRKPKASD